MVLPIMERAASEPAVGGSRQVPRAGVALGHDGRWGWPRSTIDRASGGEAGSKPTEPRFGLASSPGRIVMVSMLALWLPILLSAVLVFVVSSIIHMVFKYHRNDFLPLPDEDAVRAALGKQNLAP